MCAINKLASLEVSEAECWGGPYRLMFRIGFGRYRYVLRHRRGLLADQAGVFSVLCLPLPNG